MKKKVFRYFTIMQYKKEEDFLREMHKSGWRFEKLTGIGVYHFEQCEPQDVVYKLDYNKDGINHKSEYVQMFNDCGWEYMQDYVRYSYFRKPASNEGENNDIFCDDESRLQLVSRIAKGRIAPLLILFFAVFTQFYLSMHYNRPILAVICAVVLILYAMIFACFGIQYLKFRKNMK